MLFTPQEALYILQPLPQRTFYWWQDWHWLTPHRSGGRGRGLGSRFTVSQVFELTIAASVHVTYGSAAKLLRASPIGPCSGVEYEAQDRDFLHYFVTGENSPWVAERIPFIRFSAEECNTPVMKVWSEMLDRLREVVRRKHGQGALGRPLPGTKNAKGRVE
jgi:hypothetical protein